MAATRLNAPTIGAARGGRARRARGASALRVHRTHGGRAPTARGDLNKLAGRNRHRASTVAVAVVVGVAVVKRYFETKSISSHVACVGRCGSDSQRCPSPRRRAARTRLPPLRPISRRPTAPIHRATTGPSIRPSNLRRPRAPPARELRRCAGAARRGRVAGGARRPSPRPASAFRAPPVVARSLAAARRPRAAPPLSSAGCCASGPAPRRGRSAAGA